MTNTTIFANLLRRYTAASYARNYIFGFSFYGTIYAAIAPEGSLPFVTTLDRASRGAGYALRFKPTFEQKVFLMGGKTFALCSEAYFKAMVQDSKYNRGEVFEKLITEHFGQEWKKDTVPFTEAGDIEVKGIAYQIKFEKGTFASEKTLARLGA